MNFGMKTLFTALKLDHWRKNRADDTYTLSRPKGRIVHGIYVDKAPIGRYLDLTKRLPNIVMEVLDATFPDMKPDEILALLSSANGNPQVIRDLMTRLISVMPEKLIDVLCDLLKCDKKRVLALTPAELMDVVEAFWQMNDYTDFFQHVRKAETVMRIRQNGPSSGGSPAAVPSASANGN